MNKVVYLIEQPLSIWNYNRFGIQNWLDRGWNVEVWDLTQFLNPVIFEIFKNNNVEIKKFDGCIPISSESILKQQCSSVNKPTYYVDGLSNDSPHARIKKYLAQIGVTRIMSYLGFMPPLYLGGGASDKLSSRIIRFGLLIKSGPVNAIKWIINRVQMKFVSSLFKPGIIVVSGEKSIPKNTGSAEIIAAHNLDYDLFLNLKDTDDIVTQEYAVFIDQNINFHSDWILSEEISATTPDKYFPAVTQVLKIISIELHVSLFIAGHPRSSNRKITQEYFGRIPVRYGATAEQIKSCKFVVGHNSTSLQLAILFNKPVIFLTTNELKLNNIGAHISVMASMFGKKEINIDNDLSDIDWQKELFVDEAKYSEYRKKYIKMDGSPEKQSWDIVIDHIEETMTRKKFL